MFIAFNLLSFNINYLKKQNIKTYLIITEGETEVEKLKTWLKGTEWDPKVFSCSPFLLFLRLFS